MKKLNIYITCILFLSFQRINLTEVPISSGNFLNLKAPVEEFITKAFMSASTESNEFNMKSVNERISKWVKEFVKDKFDEQLSKAAEFYPEFKSSNIYKVFYNALKDHFFNTKVYLNGFYKFLIDHPKYLDEDDVEKYLNFISNKLNFFDENIKSRNKDLTKLMKIAVNEANKFAFAIAENEALQKENTIDRLKVFFETLYDIYDDLETACKDLASSI